MRSIRRPLRSSSATVTIDVTDTELVVACDNVPRTIRRTNTLPIRNLKANRPPQGRQ
jgi:hypothetical protein